ncbi:hypothetical protein ACWGPQ_22050 [Saccharomonospora azurea]
MTRHRQIRAAGQRPPEEIHALIDADVLRPLTALADEEAARNDVKWRAN